MRINLFLTIVALVFMSSLAFAQSAEEGSLDPYDPAVSPRNTFLYSQLRDVEGTPFLDESFDFNVNGNSFLGISAGQARKLATKNDVALIKENKGKGTVKSRLEKYYKSRTEQDLLQFGYDIFDQKEQRPPHRHLSRPVIGVQDDYVLGTGDRVVVTFMGERSDRELYSVDQNGQIVITNIEPITAAGKTIADFRKELNAILKNNYRETKAFVSIDGIQEINISVIGLVKKPGRIQMGPGSDIISVLTKAGGVKKTGSMRRIKRIRGNDVTVIDLYNVLMDDDNVSLDLGVKNGDRLIVPAIGPTVAVSGEVQNPAIFEISNETLSNPKASVDEVIAYAGGVLADGENRIILNSLDRNGVDRVKEIRLGQKLLLGKSDIVTVQRSVDVLRNNIMIKGAVRHDGLHSLDGNQSLALLLGNSSMFLPEAYPFIALLKRYNGRTLSHKYIAFSPKDVINGKFDHPLQTSDEITIFSRDNIIRALYPERFLEEEARKGTGRKQRRAGRRCYSLFEKSYIITARASWA